MPPVGLQALLQACPPQPPSLFVVPPTEVALAVAARGAHAEVETERLKLEFGRGRALEPMGHGAAEAVNALHR